MTEQERSVTTDYDDILSEAYDVLDASLAQSNAVYLHLLPRRLRVYLIACRAMGEQRVVVNTRFHTLEALQDVMIETLSVVARHESVLKEINLPDDVRMFLAVESMQMRSHMLSALEYVPDRIGADPTTLRGRLHPRALRVTLHRLLSYVFPRPADVNKQRIALARLLNKQHLDSEIERIIALGEFLHRGGRELSHAIMHMLDLLEKLHSVALVARIESGDSARATIWAELDAAHMQTMQLAARLIAELGHGEYIDLSDPLVQTRHGINETHLIALDAAFARNEVDGDAVIQHVKSDDLRAFIESLSTWKESTDD